MADYKSLEPYAKYLAGDPDKPQHRHPRLPAYEANDQGHIKIAPGERYCRFQEGVDEHGEGQLCDTTTLFSNDSNLRKHVTRHGVTIEKRHAGANNIKDKAAAKEFYAKLMAFLEDDSPMDSEMAPIVSTPSKKHVSIANKKQDKGGVPLEDQWPIPMKDNSGSQVANLAAMKMICEGEGKCDHCEQKNQPCPPPIRDKRCSIWAHFRINPLIENSTVTSPSPVRCKPVKSKTAKPPKAAKPKIPNQPQVNPKDKEKSDRQDQKEAEAEKPQQVAIAPNPNAETITLPPGCTINSGLTRSRFIDTCNLIWEDFEKEINKYKEEYSKAKESDPFDPQFYHT